MELLIAFIVIVLSVILVVWSIHRSIEKSNKKEKELSEKAQKEADSMPNSYIEFVDLEDIVHRSSEIKPYVVRNWYSDEVEYEIQSSYYKAKRLLISRMEDGYLISDKGDYYPTCNIKSARVVTNDN